MDTDEELAKLKWLLIAGIAFVASACYSYQELKYAVWGASAEASVIRSFETAELGSRGKKITGLAVEYTFTDEEGTQHQERDDVSIDWPVPEETVMVQYLLGVEDSSRLEGHSSTLFVWIFLGCSAWLGFSGYKLYREATEAVHGKRR